MGNLLKDQQPDKRAESSRRPPMQWDLTQRENIVPGGGMQLVP